MTKRPVNLHDRYHAHVYFDAASVEQASRLCQEAGELFSLQVGRIHRQPVGPHPRWSCQLAFDKDQFDRLIAWLEQHRQDLTVLVHPLTGNDLADHSVHATWLGEAVPLHLSVFGASASAAAGSSGPRMGR